MWNFHNPVRIRWCGDLSEGLRGLLPEGRGLVMVYSAVFLKTPEAQPLEPLLADAALYHGIDTNPSVSDVQKAIDFGRELSPQWILAVGGGSVMDTAKVVRFALSAGCTDVEELISRPDSLSWNRSPFLIAAPTTHGTGAELTPWATIWDKEASRKLSAASPGIYPDCALYCPPLTSALPLAPSLASALDAMSHAMEALWNRNANPVADEFALAALQLIHRHLPGLGMDTSMDCRSALLKASLFSGLAFSSTKTAAAHSISYPLTLAFHIPHGVACALPLAPLWEINAPFMKEKASRLLTALGVPTAEAFFKDIDRAVAGKIPYSLREYSAGPTDLDRLVHESFTKGRMDYNLVELSESDVRAILRKMLDKAPV